MNQSHGTLRRIKFHPQIDRLTGIPGSANFPDCLYVDHLEEVEQKLERYSLGLTRRNSDHKYLVAFSHWRLIELRWDLALRGNRVPVRLIGTELEEDATTFLVWHLKNPNSEAEHQRLEQNAACELAIERMKDLANLRKHL